MVRAEGGHLVGVTAQDADAIMGLEGGEYTARLTSSRPRSMSQLALWWVVCTMIADNFEHPGGWELTKEHVDRILRIGAGHSHVIELADGTYQFTPRSIAFNKLAQEDFNAVVDKALTVAGTKFGPALADSARRELARIVAGETRAPTRRDPKGADHEAVG